MQPKKKILIVDDEESIAEIIKVNIEQDYEVICVYNGLEAIEVALKELPDLIVLDLMLPGIDGFQVCTKLRINQKTRNIPIIMLTVKKEESDKIMGLKLGADDYMTKPFSVNELLARIEAVLRRGKVFIESKDKDIIVIRELKINYETYEVSKNDKPIELTLREFKLLYALAKKEGEIVSRENLLNEVWGSNTLEESRTLDVHIRKLRKKIEKNDKYPEYIETVRGVGYRII